MAKCKLLSRTAIFFSGLAVFVVLVALFFGVYSNHGADGPSGGSDSSPTVTVKSGVLQGQWLPGAQGEDFKFAAFRGIPYAQPPTGELRFKSPRPPKAWDGVRNATSEGNSCLQAVGVGSEDCLYLNVYSPELPTTTMQPKLPVYVFIHGGIFQFGNADMSGLGPHFLVEHGVLVVTMNYRLGVLGHLCLDTDDVPGNADLKDQVQALRWVRENIESFGGDPAKVTLGGQSSGGVSASWLTTLPATKGLIRSAITQSGSSVSSWSYIDDNVVFAKKVYEVLMGAKSEDLSEIAKAVVSAEATDLLVAAANATVLLQDDGGLGTGITFFHLPCIERRKEGKEEVLISKDPESYIIQNETNHIPIIVGETKREWATFFMAKDFATNDSRLEAVLENFITLVPKSIVPGEDTQKLLGITDDVQTMDINQHVKRVRDYYFSATDDPECDKFCKMAKYLDHSYIMTDTSHLMRLRSKYSTEPTYGYVFSLKSKYNSDTSTLPDYLKSAVVHGDDLSYIWKRQGNDYDFHGEGAASVALRRMVTMVTNFIKVGNPTPQLDSTITELWRPVRQNESETYLDINEKLTQRDDSMEGEDKVLWTEIFETIRDHRSP